MKVWNVITPDNELKTWWETWRNRILHRFPRIDKDGMVWLDGYPYVVDPKRFIRERYRPRKYLGLVEKEDQFQHWIQNEPDPVVFDRTLTPGSIGITGETIAQYAKSEHLRRLVQPQKDWLLFLIIAIIVSVAAGAIGYSVGLNQGINGGSP